MKFIVTSLIFLSNILSAISQDQIITLKNGKQIILHDDKTWRYKEVINYNFDFSRLEDNQILEFLRQGIKANKQTIRVANEMYEQGWRYTMPRPKSSQATWGNHDDRTIRWKGYWNNNKTHKYSSNAPKKKTNGYYYGDNQNQKGYWSNGGSPSYPTKIDWLLSSLGGVRAD